MHPSRAVSTQRFSVSRIIVDTLNKCTSESLERLVASAVARIQRTMLDMDACSRQRELETLVQLLVAKAEFHAQFAHTYVRAARALCAEFPDLRERLCSHLQVRACALQDDFVKGCRSNGWDIASSIVFANRLAALAQFEDEGMLPSLCHNMLGGAIEEYKQEPEAALKLVKFVLGRRGADTCVEQLQPLLRQLGQHGCVDAMPPKCRFLAQDVLRAAGVVSTGGPQQNAASPACDSGGTPWRLPGSRLRSRPSAAQRNRRL